MDKIEEMIEEVQSTANSVSAGKLPVSVIIAVRNEAKNLPRCLEALTDVGEVYVIDSQSTDETVEIARSNGAQVVQFHYQGGWPKKRQWAMNTLPIACDWILLLDADEVLTPGLTEEIRTAILGHAEYSGVPRETRLARALFACDELAGFLTACSLVKPTKSIHDVDAAGVKKKMKDKAFARGVNRDDIVKGAGELGVPLEDHIAFCITAMQKNAEVLGLQGTPAQG